LFTLATKKNHRFSNLVVFPSGDGNDSFSPFELGAISFCHNGLRPSSINHYYVLEVYEEHCSLQLADQILEIGMRRDRIVSNIVSHLVCSFLWTKTIDAFHDTLGFLYPAPVTLPRPHATIFRLSVLRIDSDICTFLCVEFSCCWSGGLSFIDMWKSWSFGGERFASRWQKGIRAALMYCSSVFVEVAMRRSRSGT